MARKANTQFTGEKVIEGETPERVWLDHIERYRFASKYVGGKEVLDISCGTGYGSRILYDSGAKRVVGVDISSTTIKFARAKYGADKLEFRVGNILDIGFPGNYFDIVVCFETIEHVWDSEKAIMELRRVLKPQGLLIISTPNRKLTSPGKSINDPPNNPFHKKEYSTGEFILVLRRYLKILEIYGQRPISKVFFLPGFEKIARKLLPMIYSPDRGGPELELLLSKKEYRYITVVCKKLESDGI
ncbi:class I SAM-dependent methyltransferase [bacterium]|nr:class I SAM-dependent methyltransferase [bacterium]